MRNVRPVMVILIMGTVLGASGRVPASPAGTGTDRRVALDVVVADKSGNPVPGLQQQDFTILDDKQPQPILSFRAFDESSKADDLPQQVIFLIDEVNAEYRPVSNARQQLEKFLRRGEGQLPIPMSLVFFTDKGTQVQGAATRNGNSLATLLSLTSLACAILADRRDSMARSSAFKIPSALWRNSPPMKQSSPAENC
jgi:VWFA-related protein